MRQIIAMGGGGFTMEPGDLSLDRYILRQTSKPKAKLCFIPTASGDSENYILRYFEAFSRLECSPSYLSLFRLPTADLEGFILEQDLVYVGGGNTRSMLALWREWGLDRILKKAYEDGVVMAGISAGANCWFEQCTTDSVPGALRVWSCLGFIQGSFSPHYDGESERRPALHRLLEDGQILAGYAADDSAAIHFVEGQLRHAICSKPTAKAYRVAWGGERVVEEALNMMHVNATGVPVSS